MSSSASLSPLAASSATWPAATASPVSAAGLASASPDLAPRVQAVILAGGTARRMGGISKADVPIKGKRMLDYLLEDLAAQQITSVTVVAPPSVQLPPGVQRSLEDPPLGGPVAGIGAGLACLRPAKELTLLLSCDAPLAARCLPALAGALIHDGAVAYHEGYRQLLVGLYRTEKLRDAVAPGGQGLRDISVKRALAGLDLTTCPITWLATDLDTLGDVENFAAQL